MRPQSKKELTLLVLSGEGERVHSLRLSRARLYLLLSAWLVLLACAAGWGFHSAERHAQGARGTVSLSAEARQK